MNNLLTDNLIILDTNKGPRVHFHFITTYRISDKQKMLGNMGYVHPFPLQFPGFEDIDIIKVYQHWAYFCFIDMCGKVYYIHFDRDFNINQIKHININIKIIDLAFCLRTVEHFSACLILKDENWDLWSYQLKKRHTKSKLEPIVGVPGVENLYPGSIDCFITTNFDKIYVCCFKYKNFDVQEITVPNKICKLKTYDDDDSIGRELFSIIYLTEDGDLYVLNNKKHYKLTSDVKILSSGNEKCIVDNDNKLKNLRVSPENKLYIKIPRDGFEMENITLCTNSIMINQDGEIYNRSGKKLAGKNTMRAFIPLNSKRSKNPYNASDT